MESNVQPVPSPDERNLSSNVDGDVATSPSRGLPSIIATSAHADCSSDANREEVFVDELSSPAKHTQDEVENITEHANIGERGASGVVSYEANLSTPPLSVHCDYKSYSTEASDVESTKPLVQPAADSNKRYNLRKERHPKLHHDFEIYPLKKKRKS